MKLRLIHASLLITEVAEKVQPPLEFAGLQCFGLIIDIDAIRKVALNPSDEKCSDGIGVPLPPGEELRK
ncbi:MAG: hypothetical protein OXU36_13990 [Candidatus Poribacteria bacterium]|nr:hypothetical protein [Candidatus Poribacteria bacterium]